jgi:hypothetical protein
MEEPSIEDEPDEDRRMWLGAAALVLLAFTGWLLSNLPAALATEPETALDRTNAELGIAASVLGILAVILPLIWWIWSSRRAAGKKALDDIAAQAAENLKEVQEDMTAQLLRLEAEFDDHKEEQGKRNDRIDAKLEHMATRDDMRRLEDKVGDAVGGVHQRLDRMIEGLKLPDRRAHPR